MRYQGLRNTFFNVKDNQNDKNSYVNHKFVHTIKFAKKEKKIELPFGSTTSFTLLS